MTSLLLLALLWPPPAPPVKEVAEPARNIPAPDDEPKSKFLEDADFLDDLGEPGQMPAGADDADLDLLDGLAGDIDELDDPGNLMVQVGEKMRTVEQRLLALDRPADTVEIQQQIVRDLDKLLQQANQQNSPQQNQNQKKDRKDRQKERQQQLANRQQQQARQSQSRQDQAKPGEKSGSKALPGAAGVVDGQAEPEKMNVWGHLGAMFRDEMGQYAKEKFHPQYRDALERYYAEIADKSDG